MTLGKLQAHITDDVANFCSLWGIYLVTDKLTRIDDLVHFTLREWSRLSYNVTEAEVERAKAQLKASLLLSLDGTTAVAEDIGRQIITTGRRMGPEEIERVVGAITEKDVMSFAQRKLWDQDVAVSAIGSIEGLLDYNRVCAYSRTNTTGFEGGDLRYCFGSWPLVLIMHAPKTTLSSSGRNFLKSTVLMR